MNRRRRGKGVGGKRDHLRDRSRTTPRTGRGPGDGRVAVRVAGERLHLSIGTRLKIRTVSVGPSQPMPPAVSRRRPAIRW